uniref:F-box domain-containing protein n=1 Tax=Oryza brachyantha TaxID=4533 RepID=J3MN03_ORYBR
MAAVVAKCGGGKKRKCGGEDGALGEMHDDVLERVLARLPPASFFRLRGVCRRWRAAAASPTAVYDSSKDAWEDAVALSRKPEASSPEREAEGGIGGGDETVYFLSKSGDVMATNMQRSASRQYSSVVTCGDGGEAVAYFLSHSGAVVACDLARRVFSELPRILPVYFEYSIDVVACGGRAYVVVLWELLDTASLRVWEFAGGAWRQVAAMPPSMSHAFHGKKADVNCVGHGDRLMVCVSSGEAANGCFMCDVTTNRWDELPPCAAAAGDGQAMDFVAAFSFEPRMEVAV